MLLRLLHAPTKTGMQFGSGFTRKLRRLRDRIAYQLDPQVDRHILEAGVFPALKAQPDVRRILFVGCDWYTRQYTRHFPGREFRTIDIDPTKARYGSPDHIVGSVLELSSLVERGSYDAIVCSGVIGFGVQTNSDVDRMINNFFEALRPGGWLVLGWNDVADLTPFDLASVKSLANFEPVALPPFPAPRFPTFSPAKHTFNFYRTAVTGSVDPATGQVAT